MEYSLKILPIENTEQCCICAVGTDEIFESPHGEYESYEKAHAALSILRPSDDEIKSEWVPVL